MGDFGGNVGLRFHVRSSTLVIGVEPTRPIRRPVQPGKSSCMPQLARCEMIETACNNRDCLVFGNVRLRFEAEKPGPSK